MALFITFGTSLIQKVGMVEVIRSVCMRQRSVWFILAVDVRRTNCGFPFTPLLMSVIALVGIDSQRLSSKLSCFLFLLVAVTYFGKKLREIRALLVFF